MSWYMHDMAASTRRAVVLSGPSFPTNALSSSEYAPRTKKSYISFSGSLVPPRMARMSSKCSSRAASTSSTCARTLPITSYTDRRSLSVSESMQLMSRIIVASRRITDVSILDTCSPDASFQPTYIASVDRAIRIHASPSTPAPAGALPLGSSRGVGSPSNNRNDSSGKSPSPHTTPSPRAFTAHNRLSDDPASPAPAPNPRLARRFSHSLRTS